jgi:hypothetical protein
MPQSKGICDIARSSGFEGSRSSTEVGRESHRYSLKMSLLSSLGHFHELAPLAHFLSTIQWQVHHGVHLEAVLLRNGNARFPTDWYAERRESCHLSVEFRDIRTNVEVAGTTARNRCSTRVAWPSTQADSHKPYSLQRICPMPLCCYDCPAAAARKLPKRQIDQDRAPLSPGPHQNPPSHPQGARQRYYNVLFRAD